MKFIIFIYIVNTIKWRQIRSRITCVFSNYNVKKVKGKTPKGGHINWLVERKRARIEFMLSVFIAAVSAEFFVPPIVNQFGLHITFSPAIAFFIGYSGMRLIPMMERKVSQALDKLS